MKCPVCKTVEMTPRPLHPQLKDVLTEAFGCDRCHLRLDNMGHAKATTVVVTEYVPDDDHDRE